MSLSAGSQFGQYEIVGHLGAGGMGEVYRARDLRLKREIALKVLPASLANDPERRAWFTREAQTVAALNHPNIVTIHSVEEVDGVQFLTMELIDGQPLSAMIRKGGLTLDEVLTIALPLTDALFAAHQGGVTHRDLKPGNVMIGVDGRLKVLDFGLARWRPDSPAASGTPTMSTEFMTTKGQILGTVAYMSPEQAEGRPLDHRTDIFSFGVLLYELATGRRPFTGASNLAILSSVLKDTPPVVMELNRSLPPELGHIVKRCLEKDPEDRYQSARDLRYELRQLKQGELGTGSTASHVVRRRPTRSMRRLAIGLAGVLVAALLAWAVLMPRRSTSRPQALDVTFAPLTSQPGAESFPSLSPDGKWVIYSSAALGNADIYLQSTSGQVPINLTKDSAADETQPAFSPDGERIVFQSTRDGGGLFIMGRTGESPSRLTDSGFNPAWSPDGREVVYATLGFVEPSSRVGNRSELWIVEVANGKTRRLAEADAVQPSWSPHGLRIAYWAIPLGASQRDLWTVPASGGRPERVTDDAAVDWNPRWSPDGAWLFFASDRGGAMNLWRVPIDERSGRALGQPEPITAPAQKIGAFGLSADGRRLVFESVQEASNIVRVPFDPISGRVTADPVPITSGSNLYSGLAASPDGQWLAFTSLGRQEDLFVSRSNGSERRQLTNDAAKDRSPRWAPNGSRIAFYSDRGGKYEIWTIRPDGGDARQHTQTAVTTGDPVWSPDGSRLAVSDSSGAIHLIDPSKTWNDQDLEPLPRWSGDGDFSAWTWSPEGKMLAGYLSGSSRGGLVVYEFARRQYRQVLDFGERPIWLRDNVRLLFTAEGQLHTVNTRTGKTEPILSIGLSPPAFNGGFDLASDNRTLFTRQYVHEGDLWLATTRQ